MTEMHDPWSNWPVQIAEILEAIPSSTNGAINFQDMCLGFIMDEEWCRGCGAALIALLNTFDAITISDVDNVNGPKVKASSLSAFYFIRSLAAYLREGQKIVSNWERPGIGEGPYSVHEVLSGPQFLYFIEHKRITDRGNAIAIRKATVVKAIIKARIRGRREPVFLAQFDPLSRQYQLIGGHKRATDPDVETALRRELEEELKQNALRFPSNYELLKLGKVASKEISLTYGVYTAYDLHYFQVKFKDRQLSLGPNDHWITSKELISGKAKNGIGINESAIAEINRSLPGGLNGLSLSLDQVQHRTLRQVVADHPWETLGITISVLGIVLSIIFFLLSR